MTDDITATRRRPPVTRHPLFPLVVGLWFAALFALASFALRTSLIEGWVVASGIDAAVPAAAPPLGNSARLLIALLFAGIGGAIGLTVAKSLAQPQQRAPLATRTPNAEEWPGVAYPAEAEAVELAPIPDGEKLALPPETLAEPEPLQEILEPLPAEPAEPTAAERIAAANLDDLSHVELIERLAIALERRRERGSAEFAVLDQGQRALCEFIRPAQARQTNGHLGEGVVSFRDLAARRDAQAGAHTASSGHDPVATERALRQALTSLQRMSQTS